MSISSDHERIMEAVRGLLSSRYFAVLSTVGRTHPYVSLVGFAATGDLRAIVFATMEDTNKYRNISSDPHVSLLVDNRTNSAEDLEKAVAVTVLGEASRAEGKEREVLEPVYLARHPELDDFIEDPRTALVRIAVSRYIFVSRFQEVFELEMP